MNRQLTNPRLGAVLAATAALALAATAPGQADQARRGASPVAGSAKAQVVRTASGDLVARSVTTGHRTRLAPGIAASLVDVDGNYVGVSGRFGDRIEVRSIDARTGRVTLRARTPNVLALEVRRTGTLVWVAQHGTSRSVHGRNAGGSHVLGTGTAIDPQSLAVADSDTTTAHVYWTDGGVPATAAIE
ncbi:MAG TPA: hypothetical protein VF549_16370 [Solirubrobacteraceae bacterium]|jgi:hypothetical protein